MRVQVHSPTDTGVEIGPGVVVVDMSVAPAHALTPAALRAAFEESEAQAVLDALHPEEVLGDLDISPL